MWRYQSIKQDLKTAILKWHPGLPGANELKPQPFKSQSHAFARPELQSSFYQLMFRCMWWLQGCMFSSILCSYHYFTYCQTSNISCTKSPNFNVTHVAYIKGLTATSCWADDLPNKMPSFKFSAANLALAGFPLTKTLGENLPSRL